jgi:hypothetical protein
MALATRDQILGVKDIGFIDLDMSEVSGWEGITLRVKDLNGRERDALESSIVVERTTKVNGKKQKTQELRDNVRATFCAACIVDEQMQPIFSKSDIAALGNKSARALDKIFTIIRDRNRISDDDVEELAGNFTSDQEDDSHTV